MNYHIINMTPVEIYKKTVDFCKKNNIKDYEKDISLINHYNRDKFIKLLEDKSKLKELNRLDTITSVFYK